jgi:hypothetical protein
MSGINLPAAKEYVEVGKDYTVRFERMAVPAPTKIEEAAPTAIRRTVLVRKKVAPPPEPKKEEPKPEPKPEPKKAEPKPEPKKQEPKAEPKKQKECPHCGKKFINLEEHITKAHRVNTAVIGKDEDGEPSIESITYNGSTFINDSEDGIDGIRLSTYADEKPLKLTILHGNKNGTDKKTQVYHLFADYDPKTKKVTRLEGVIFVENMKRKNGDPYNDYVDAGGFLYTENLASHIEKVVFE